jgi:hypothetical protein
VADALALGEPPAAPDDELEQPAATTRAAMPASARATVRRLRWNDSICASFALTPDIADIRP